MELNKETQFESAIRLNMEILADRLTDIIDRAINLKDEIDDTWCFVTESQAVEKPSQRKTQADSSLDNFDPF